MKDKKINIKIGEDLTERETIFKWIVGFVLIILLGRMLHLQIFKKNEYDYLSQKNRVRLRRIEAERGNIYDSKGELIVTNVLGYRLIYLKQRFVSEKELTEMSEVTGYDKDYLKKRVEYGEIVPYTRENILIEDLDVNLAHKIMEKLGEYPYLEIEEYSKRRYVYDSVAAHTIGYVKKITSKEYDLLKNDGYSPRDIVGKIGIEKKYDLEMKGKIGYEYVEVNALNKAQKIEKRKEPKNGYDLHLSLDMSLQRYMEEIFEKENLSGSIIAIEAKTGKIITIVSYPTYSLTTFSSRIPQEEWNIIIKDPKKPLMNKSIAGEYPPGSVFKPFSAFGFFNEGLKPSKEIFDPGFYALGKWKWRSWKIGGHGNINFEKSIIESVNTYYYKFADEYGLDPIIKVASDFGFGKLSQIDIPGEKIGILPNDEWKRKKYTEKWYRGDTITLAIGQSYLLSTPMQVAIAYMGLANQGKAYVPQVVNYFQNGNEKKYVEPKILYNLVGKYPKWYYKNLNRALIKTVEDKNGTTRALKTEGVVIAAKSGSSQNSKYEGTHALVAGYFPADKEPEIVFTVLLEGAGGGGTIAGGLAKKFIDKYLENKNKEEK